MYTPTATLIIFISSITRSTYSKYFGVQIDCNKNNTDREFHSSRPFHNLFPEFTREILDPFSNSHILYSTVLKSKSN